MYSKIAQSLLIPIAVLCVGWYGTWIATPEPTMIQEFRNGFETQYDIDNSHSSVIFAVNHFGLSYVYGRFNTIGGTFAMDGSEVTSAGFRFKIETASIDTNNEERDKHLRDPDFFDADQFPEITFATTGFKKVDNEYQVTGDLKLRDQIREVTIPIRPVGIGKDPFGKERAGFFGKFSIKRSEFGMDKMIGSIGDNVSITLSFEGIKKE